jgi:hypothetical protein
LRKNPRFEPWVFLCIAVSALYALLEEGLLGAVQRMRKAQLGDLFIFVGALLFFQNATDEIQV